MPERGTPGPIDGAARDYGSKDDRTRREMASWDEMKKKYDAEQAKRSQENPIAVSPEEIEDVADESRDNMDPGGNARYIENAAVELAKQGALASFKDIELTRRLLEPTTPDTKDTTDSARIQPGKTKNKFSLETRMMLAENLRKDKLPKWKEALQNTNLPKEQKDSLDQQIIIIETLLDSLDSEAMMRGGRQAA